MNASLAHCRMRDSLFVDEKKSILKFTQPRGIGETRSRYNHTQQVKDTISCHLSEVHILNSFQHRLVRNTILALLVLVNDQNLCIEFTQPKNHKSGGSLSFQRRFGQYSIISPENVHNFDVELNPADCFKAMQSNSDVAGDNSHSSKTADGNSAVRALARDHYFAKMAAAAVSCMMMISKRFC